MNAAIFADVYYVDKNCIVHAAKVIERKNDYLIEFEDGSRTRTSDFNIFRSRAAANRAVVNRISSKFNDEEESKTFFKK